MTVALLIAIVLSLTARGVVLSRQWRHKEESGFGLMSRQWISEQRADESRHRTI